MVKVGFIVEGGTEKILVESLGFNTWLQQHGIELIHPVIDAEGSGNLLPKNIEPMIRQLQAHNPNHIVILTDLERDPSIAEVKRRIGTEHTDLIFVAVKAIESWFLADTDAMIKWLKVDSFYENLPEQTPDLPWDRLKEISSNLNKKGPGSSKPVFAKRMVKHNGFMIANAAQHLNCPSAKFFIDGLNALATST